MWPIHEIGGGNKLLDIVPRLTDISCVYQVYIFCLLPCERFRPADGRSAALFRNVEARPKKQRLHVREAVNGCSEHRYLLQQYEIKIRQKPDRNILRFRCDSNYDVV